MSYLFQPEPECRVPWEVDSVALQSSPDPVARLAGGFLGGAVLQEVVAAEASIALLVFEGGPRRGREAKAKLQLAEKLVRDANWAQREMVGKAVDSGRLSPSDGMIQLKAICFGTDRLLRRLAVAEQHLHRITTTGQEKRNETLSLQLQPDIEQVTSNMRSCQLAID